MVRLVKIAFGQVRTLIDYAYQGDTDLYEKYTVPAMPHEDCVNLQMVNLKQAAQDVKLNLHKVIYQKRPIGFVATFNDVLFAFAINKNYRKPEVLKDTFIKITEVLPEKFACVLYKHNTRALKFLERCGMMVMPETESSSNNNAVTLFFDENCKKYLN